MRVLLLGDIVGKAGRRAVRALVPSLRAELATDYVIANAENAAAGRGTTEKIARDLLGAGIDVLTGGNHTWAVRDFSETLASELPVLRPANYPKGAPGSGVWSDGHLTVMNLIGRTFMQPLDDPFALVDTLIAEVPTGRPIVVDFHAEATSEKLAMGWHLDGRVTAVVGTHTHVPTADPKVLPRGTAFVTDLGMTGPVYSVIGSRVEDVLTRFLTAMPRRLNVAEDGPVQMNSVLIDVDERIGLATAIQRVDRTLEL